MESEGKKKSREIKEGKKVGKVGGGDKDDYGERRKGEVKRRRKSRKKIKEGRRESGK